MTETSITRSDEGIAEALGAAEAVSRFPPGTIFRIDSFRIPETARAAFLERAGAVQTVLRGQRGLLAEFGFERIGGPGRFNLVTLAAWADEEAIAGAGAAVAAANRESGFDRAAFLAEQGIEAEIATFRAFAL